MTLGDVRAWSASSQIRRRFGGPVAGGSKRVAEKKSDRPSATIASAIAREHERTSSLAGRVKAERERPHSPVQLQPRAEVPWCELV